MYRQPIFWLGILTALLFAASFGAFLLYVPVLSVMAISSTLLGFILMFALGAQAASRTRSAEAEVRETVEPESEVSLKRAA